MKKLKLAYFGTPDFAADFLEKILNDTTIPVEVCLVVTQPDKPKGRKLTLTPSPVKSVANSHSIKVFDGEIKTLSDTLNISEFDLALLYAYGEYIPESLITSFKLGFWNIHPSLLPLYRNVAPMAYPLLLGDSQTGISIIQLDNKLDHGPILLQKSISLNGHERRSDLEKILTDLAYKEFRELVELAVAGNAPPLLEQDHEKATYTRFLTKADGFVEFSLLKKCLKNVKLKAKEFPQILREYLEKYSSFAESIPSHSSALLFYNMFRALFPWPGIWTVVCIHGEEKRLKINDIKYEDKQLQIVKVQLEGKNEVDFTTFQSAYELF